MKKILIGTVVVAAAYPIASWQLGAMVNRQITTELEKTSKILPIVKVTEDIKDVGIFSSTRKTTLTFTLEPTTCPPPPPDLEALKADATAADELAKALESQIAELKAAAASDNAEVDGETIANAESELAAATEAAKAAQQSVVDAQKPVVPEGPKTFSVTVNQKLAHGPFPGFSAFGAAKIDYSFLIENKAIGDLLKQSTFKTTGELPTITSLYGFTGGSTATVASKVGAIEVAEAGKSLVFSWQPFKVTVHGNSKMSSFVSKGLLPSLTVVAKDPEDGEITVNFKNLAFDDDQQHPLKDSFFATTGKGSFSLAEMGVTSAKVNFSIKDLSGDHNSTLKDGLLEMSNQMLIKSIETGKTKVGPVHYDTSMRRIDGKAYSDFVMTMLKPQKPECGPDADPSDALKPLKASFGNLLKANPEIALDRLSVGFGGEEIKLVGKVSLTGATAADLEGSGLITKLKASANAETTDKFIAAAAAAVMSAQAGGEGDAEQQAQMKAMLPMMVEQQLESAVASNFIVRTNGKITASASFENGTALVNGKPFSAMGGAGGELEAEPSAEVDPSNLAPPPVEGETMPE